MPTQHFDVTTRHSEVPTQHSKVPTRHSKVPIRHSEVPTRDWEVAPPMNIVRKKSLEEVQGKSYIIQREENGKQILRCVYK